MTILIKRMVLDRCITMMLTKENDKCDFAQEEVIKTMIKTKTKTKTKTKSKPKKMIKLDKDSLSQEASLPFGCKRYLGEKLRCPQRLIME